MKKCPYCAEEIQDEALKCKFCGTDFKKAEEQAEQEKKDKAKAKRKKIIVVLCWFFLIWFIRYCCSTTSSVLEEAENYSSSSNNSSNNSNKPLTPEEQAQLQTEYEEIQEEIKQMEAQCNTSYDEFNKITWIRPNTIKDTNNQNAIMIYLGKTDDGKITRRLKIMYAGKEWLFIQKYQFSIGGEVIDYIPSEVERDNYTTVWEWSDNYVSSQEDSLITKIINNNGGKIRYNGQQYYHDWEIPENQVKTLKDMNDLYYLLLDEQDYKKKLNG